MKNFSRLVASGSISNGKFLFKNARWVKGMFQQFADAKDVTVTFEKKRRKRSLDQLRYLWGVVYPTISESTGHTPEELHAVFKTMFLKRKVHWRQADMVVLTSTSKLTLTEMAEFLTNVITYAASELGIEVPPPLTEEEQIKRSLS